MNNLPIQISGSHVDPAASVFSPARPRLGVESKPQRRIGSSLKELCAILRIHLKSPSEDDETVFQHVQFKAGQRIHTIGQPFDNLYIVHSGFLKTVMINEYGSQQVLGFPMKGDLFGIDGIQVGRYASEAVALCICDVIFLPFKKLKALSRVYPEIEDVLYSLMSRELVREYGVVSVMGAAGAEARLARFLISLSERFSDIGYSSKMFSLPMTRQEIGSYLGLTVETICRALSGFSECGLISVDHRAIHLNDVETLRTLRRLPPASYRVKHNASRKSKRIALKNDRELIVI